MTDRTIQTVIKSFTDENPETHSVLVFRRFLRLKGWSEKAVKTIVDYYIQSELRKTHANNKS